MANFDNQAVLRRAIEKWNEGNLDAYLELYAHSVVLHSVPEDFPAGVEGVRKMYEGMWSSYPGSLIQIDDLLGEGQKVACRYTVQAAHGDTHEEVTFAGITILHFADGKCVERWDFDRIQR